MPSGASTPPSGAAGCSPRSTGRRGAPPDYIALIEAAGPGDQGAARLKDVIERLVEAGTAIDIWNFIGDPCQCYADLGGRPTALAKLTAAHPYHRLLLLGEAAGFLDPIDFTPYPWTGELEAFERRVVSQFENLSGLTRVAVSGLVFYMLSDKQEGLWSRNKNAPWL